MTGSKTTQSPGKATGERRESDRRVGPHPFDGGDKRTAQRRVVADRRAARRD